MLTWYQSKVKYDQTVEGKIKTVSELFLHEAVNFGEVEKHCYEQLKRRIKDPDVDAIAKATYDYVVFFSGTDDHATIPDPFYRIDLNWLDEKTSYLIPAKDAEQAIERALAQHGSADASHVTNVKKTDIQSVWHPNNELWQGDWYNRQDMLKELGRHSWDINQSELFNDDGSAKDDDDD
ncbi:DUF4494 family protein [Spirosoma validum]|uniref:DUF4494 family protein n=1 Tax=Spirosoma validum TaxID=2771355 RepID=A0A927GDH9_9BACT|nr:DUF4494 family protein [Spirosoma validum]MBD2753817.1 DUF4494 family protein [Spirosoma validum]